MKFDKNLVQLSIATASSDENVRNRAFAEYIEAISLPLREAVLDGDILFDIFSPVETLGESTPSFPLHFVEPGTESDYSAYTIPHCGGMPQRAVVGDEIKLHTYRIGNSIDTCLDYIERGRFDVQSEMLKVYRNGFVQKANRDGWRTIIAAAKARNVIVTDPSADAGQLTKRLVSLMMTVMERNGGGNSTSVNGSALTDLFMSTELTANIRNWNVDQIDELTRREIHMNNGRLSRLFGVNFHTLRELGVGQEFQNYAVNNEGVVMPGSTVELVVGLDLSSDSSFVAPVSKPLETFVDPTLHRLQKWGIYGWMGLGFGVMDTRKVLFGAA